jgi:cytochrome c556
MFSSGSRPAHRQRAVLCVSVLVSLGIAGAAISQSSPPAPSAAKRAVDERKAVFTLIGSSFRPLGEQLRGGGASLDANEARKRADRVAFLASMANEAFPDVSNAGEGVTRAKPEIWTKRSEFDKLIGDFVKHSQALSQVVAAKGTQGEEFKAAAQAVAGDCKNCHDNWRSK